MQMDANPVKPSSQMERKSSKKDYHCSRTNYGSEIETTSRLLINYTS